MQWRPINALVRGSARIVVYVVNGATGTRDRPKQTCIKAIKNDMIIQELTFNGAEWKKSIHLANSKNWDKGFVFWLYAL